jgi:hypothetical protein
MEGSGIIAVLALLVPVIMMVILFVPPYACAIASLWFIYGHAIFSKWYKFGLVVSVFQKLYHQWEKSPALTVWNFFLPVFGPVIFGMLLSLWLMYRFMRYIKGVFQP